jgi:hypothetical protein
MRSRYIACGALLVGLVFCAWWQFHATKAPVSPPDHSNATPAPAWTANATLTDVQTHTLERVGAAQGVSLRDGKVYIYGDVWDAQPRAGVIREYTVDLKPTGRVVWLTAHGKNISRHPTGLTWHPRWGTFLGDTVDRNATIYRIDWDRAWSDGNLDRAVLDVIEDDAALNGCRPEYVEVEGKEYLATADYGNIRPEVRLYDPAKLLESRRTSAPGVVAHRFLAGPFNQNLHWDSVNHQLVCVQNVIEGKGWQLDVIDLPAAIRDGRAWGPGVRIRKWTFDNADELEGYRPFRDGLALFVTASRKGNVVVAVPRESRISDPK